MNKSAKNFNKKLKKSRDKKIKLSLSNSNDKLNLRLKYKRKDSQTGLSKKFDIKDTLKMIKKQLMLKEKENMNTSNVIKRNFKKKKKKRGLNH